jgi:hypothetical protein
VGKFIEKAGAALGSNKLQEKGQQKRGGGNDEGYGGDDTSNTNY